MQIHTLRAFTDNYMFVVTNDLTGEAAVVDPGQAKPVQIFLNKHGLKLTHILVTHHHRDHTLGVAALQEDWGEVTVVSSPLGKWLGRSFQEARAGDRFRVCGAEVQIIEIPAHTKDHIAFYFPKKERDNTTPHLFAGDTIFPGTCGNLFEGTPKDMLAALKTIRNLPAETLLWYAHEYSFYLRDAQQQEPWNLAITERFNRIETQLKNGKPGVPGQLADEIATNPLLHWDAPEVRARYGTTKDLETFLAIAQAAG